MLKIEQLRHVIQGNEVSWSRDLKEFEKHKFQKQKYRIQAISNRQSKSVAKKRNRDTASRN